MTQNIYHAAVVLIGQTETRPLDRTGGPLENVKPAAMPAWPTENITVEWLHATRSLAITPVSARPAVLH